MSAREAAAGRRLRFISMIQCAEDCGPPPPALMAATEQLAEEFRRSGVVLDLGGLLPTAAGAQVRVAGGKVAVTDGPFAESKEVVGGYAIFEVESKAEAIAWTERFMRLHAEHWPGWKGGAELRQIAAV